MATWLIVVLTGFAPRAAAADAKAEAAIRESVLRLTAGDVVGAEDQAKAAVASAPADARALQQLALAADAAQDFAAGEDAATRGLAAAGPLPALLCLRSEARAGRGNFAGALDDAQKAVGINPGSAKSYLLLASAEENLGRPADQVLSDYDRASELDAGYRAEREAARARLAPRPRGAGRAPLVLIALVAGAAACATVLIRRRRIEPAARPPGPVLPGKGRLAPRAAVRVLAEAAASAPGPDEARSLAESLYERLTGKPPYRPEEAVVARSLGRFAPPSALVPGLPVGLDSFFARALNPDAERRFRSGAELAGAFRSLVDPAVD
jgi:tetratricopeptide (TPR) repeat protein